MRWHSSRVGNKTTHLGIKLTVKIQKGTGLRVGPALVFMFRLNPFDWKDGDRVRGGRC